MSRRQGMARGALILLLILAATSTYGQTAAFSPAEIEQAQAQIANRLEGITDTPQRLIRLAAVAFADRPKGVLEVAAAEMFDREALSGPGVAIQVFGRVPPAGQIRILDLHRENWSFLGRNTNTQRDETVRFALTSPVIQVRRAAAHLAASRPFPRITHHMIDAALRHPELTEAAFYTVAINGEHRATRWIVENSVHQGPVRRETGLWVISRIGPSAKRMIVERLDDADGEYRVFALDALLGMATPEDASLLHSWLDTWGAKHPERSEVVLGALAELEAGRSLLHKSKRREFTPGSGVRPAEKATERLDAPAGQR